MAATRTVNGGKDAAGVTLDALPPIRDYLIYKVTVSGSQPDFELVEQGSQKVLLQPQGAAVQTYKRKWPSAAELQQINPDDSFRHILGMKFLGAVSYRFVVERYGSDDELVETLTDVTWSSQ